MATTQRYYILDGLRGIAAISVMIYHYTQHNPLLTWQLTRMKIHLFFCTDLAVDFFFMLSGFVIAHSYGARLLKGMPTSDYLLRRFIRLYPLFLLGLILGTIALYFISKTPSSDFTLRTLSASFLLNAAWIPFLHNINVWDLGSNVPTKGEIFPSNTPSWSLFFEMLASASFVILIKLRFKKLLYVSLSALIVWMCIGSLYSFSSGNSGIDFGMGWGTFDFMGGFPRVLYGFSAGIILYRLSLHKRIALKLCRIDIKNSYLLYILLLLVLAFPKDMNGLYQLLILTIVAPSIILIGARLPCQSKAEIRLAEFLGWLSYPIYCLHFPIGRAAWLIGKQTQAPLVMTVWGAIFATLLCAILLTKFVEEPVRDFLSSKLLRPQNKTLQSSSR